MQRIARHYATELGLRYGDVCCLGLLDRQIASYRENGLVDRAFDIAQLQQYSNIGIHTLRGRKFELEHGCYREELYDPGDLYIGSEAFEAYRRGNALVTKGRIKEAEDLYARTIEAEPQFSLALRRYGDILRRRDAKLAAKSYSAALEYPPRLAFGSGGAIGNINAVSEDYRNFTIFRMGQDYVAVPAAIGSIDPSVPAFRSAFRRLLGLLLMRLRLRARLENNLTNEAALKVIESKSYQRVWPKRLRNWLRSSMVKCFNRNIRYFQFLFVDSSERELLGQIDMVNREWLSRTHTRK
jgi:tetratricopeptide (TPR) repeat protein